MTGADALSRAFLTYAVRRLEDCRQQIARCVGLLTPEQVWHRPNDVSNAIGNLLLHLDGNVRQWILGRLGGEPVERDRPAEFAARGGIDPSTLVERLDATVARAAKVIEASTPEDLAVSRVVQGYEVSGLAVVFHVVEHFSLHTGQIVYATKLLTGRDLSLYDPEGRPIDPDRARAP